MFANILAMVAMVATLQRPRPPTRIAGPGRCATVTEPDAEQTPEAEAAPMSTNEAVEAQPSSAQGRLRRQWPAAREVLRVWCG